MLIWNKIIVFLLGMLIVYLMYVLFKTNKEGIQYEIEQNFIATKDIPRLTRTIHCCDNLENLKCNGKKEEEHVTLVNSMVFYKEHYLVSASKNNLKLWKVNK